MNTTFWGVRCVWLRYLDVYLKNLVYGLMTTCLEPVLYLTSFGYGLGGMIGNVTVGDHTLSYRQFILAGVAAQSAMFQGFFDGAYGSFIRMYYQKIFKAMSCTPITLSEVLWGELLWDASKATFSASVVLLVGVAIGDFSPLGALACVPVLFVGSLLFSSIGLLTASYSNTIEQINYPQYLFIFPMFLFCGLYFPLSQLPSFLHPVAWALPMTSLVSLIRTLTLGTPFQLQTIPLLLAWMIAGVLLSRRGMVKRLVK